MARGPKTSTRRFNDKRRREPRRGQKPDHVLGQIELLEQRREPFGEVARAIVQDLLTRFPPLPDLALLEIGSGTGALRRWLPDGLTARLLHTDPSADVLKGLERRHPGAMTEVASAESLPVGDGACGMVLGLCAFDAVQHRDRAAREIERVLARGGRFVHLLDMTTLLEAPFSEIAEAGFVPLPNLFGDPGDHEWPLDLALVPAVWLAQLLQVAAARGSGAPAELVRYVRLFQQPFAAHEAAKAFHGLGSHAAPRRELARFLSNAVALARASGASAPSPVPFHSGQYFLKVLMTHFGDPRRFEVEFAEVVTREVWRKARLDEETRYRSLCLGHERRATSFPGRLLSSGARERFESGTVPTDATLTELGVMAFVARRR